MRDSHEASNPPGPENMPRYVILRHDLPAQAGRGLHWDLMLEVDGTLKTWALDAEPAAARSISAMQLDDHRLAYLEYEGPVCGDRGQVTRWDHGPYEVRQWDEERIVVVLAGQRWRCRVSASHVDQARWSVAFDVE